MQKDYVRSQHPALQGASLAFGVPQPSPKPMTDTYSGANGAVTAAFVAGMGRQRADIDKSNHNKLSGTPVTTDAFFKGTRSEKTLNDGAFGSTEKIKRPTSRVSIHQQSPSHIAASLAAARSTSTSVLQDRQSMRVPRSTHSHSPPKLPSSDGGPPPATNTLIKFFETKKQVSPEGTTHYAKPAPPISSPIPIRLAMEVCLSSRKVEYTEKPGANGNGTNPNPFVSKDDITLPEVRSARRQDVNSSATYAKDYEQLLGVRPSHLGTRTFPVQNATPKSADSSRPFVDNVLSKPFPTSAHSSPLDASLPKISREERITHPPRKPPPSSPNTIQPMPLLKPDARYHNHSTLGSVPKARSVSGRPIPQLTADSLANAIVASSLATSRASSPTKTAPPPVPWRQSKQYSLFGQNHVHEQAVSRTPSPAKVLRHTMRGPPRSDEDDERVKKNRLLNKHPNKHNEGDRKRWRDQITERERKRYEGVWAANRGYFISDSEPPDAVNNLIVRDIWSRSQLSSSVLADIWNLVEIQGVGRLSREEFVVGMWLVDQCLKGRKLPVKVSESVWSSVTRLSGITISNHRR